MKFSRDEPGALKNEDQVRRSRLARQPGLPSQDLSPKAGVAAYETKSPIARTTSSF